MALHALAVVVISVLVLLSVDTASVHVYQNNKDTAVVFSTILVGILIVVKMHHC